MRRGRRTELPQLASGEFGWAVDSQEIYIGNGAVSEGAPYVGNTKLLSEHDDLFTLADQYVYKNGTKVIIKNNDDKKPRRKRCPNGTRKNTKTGKCESINKADKNEEVLTETKDDNKKLTAPPRSLSRRPVPPTYLDSDAHRPLDRDNNSLLARLGFSGTNDDNKPAEANDVNKPAKVLAEANDDNKKLADNNSLFARLGF